MPQRLAQINDWLQKGLGLMEYHIAPASSDASFRRYFRVSANSGTFNAYQAGDLIVMDAPPFREDVGPYIRIARLMSELGLHVPLVLEENREQGFLLLSDLGSVQYLSILDKHNVDHLYQDALAALLILQAQGPRQSDDLPSYDLALLQRGTKRPSA